MALSPPRAPRLPNILGAALPKVGAFWTAGGPGALALEVTDARGELDFRVGGERGEYRRPLEEDGLGLFQLRGLRWQALGNGAVTGRVVADRSQSDDGSPGSGVWRHTPDPFALTDTTAPPMQHVRARIEGAYGHQWGGWGAGLALALEVSDDRSREARLGRLGRSSVPALSGGVARRLSERIHISVHARWAGATESLRLAAAGSVLGVANVLQGYQDPEPAVFANRVYTRVIERDNLSVGGAVAGRSGAWDWVVHGEWVGSEDSQRLRQFGNEPRDRWEGAGWMVGGSAGGHALDRRLFLWVSGRYRTSDGDAFRADLDGAIVRRSGGVAGGEAEARYRPRDGNWTLAGTLEWKYEQQSHLDFLAETRSEITGSTAGGSLEVVRRLGSRTSLSIGGGGSLYSAVSTLPNPHDLGPVYQALIAPELALYASQAGAWTAGASVRHDLSEAHQLLLRIVGSGLSPAGGGTVPLAPPGARNRWSLSLGFRWSGRGF